MRLGERWNKDESLRHVLHRLDLVIGLLLLIALMYFGRSHWKNRLSATASLQ
jgi:hypothetical protein